MLLKNKHRVNKKKRKLHNSQIKFGRPVGIIFMFIILEELEWHLICWVVAGEGWTIL
jgi:hypothetical protein